MARAESPDSANPKPQPGGAHPPFQQTANPAAGHADAHHRSLFHHSLDAVLLTTTDGVILSANPAAERMLGYPPGGLEALGRADIIDLTDPRLPHALEERERTGRFRGELTLRRADGTRFPGEIASAVFEDSNGARCTSLIIRDITRRKAAERALHESETSFRNLFDSITESVSIQTRAGAFLDVNPAFLSMYGYRRDEIIGKLPGMLADRERVDFRESVLRFNQALAGHPQRFEWWGRRRSGESFPQEIVLTRGTYFGQDVVISVAREVTDQKNLELQLRQSQKMEAVGRLAGGVAHDFNNLLTVIRGNAEILEAKLESDGQSADEISEISKAAGRAAELTHQLLAFSRRQVLMPRRLSLNDVITEMERMLRRLIGEDVEMSVTLDPDVGETLADPGQIQQVVMNLAINARDAMPTGGTLSLETRRLELPAEALLHSDIPTYVAPGSYASLRVGDTGTGMDRVTMARLFEPFFTTKEPGKGTGLGLSTVYGIVKQSEGFVWAESEEGSGSIFTVLLPRVAATSGARRSPGPAPNGRSGGGGSETLLLVEDDVALRDLLKRVLERAGYAVLEAVDGEDAYRICARHPGPIHLVLTDVVMPGTSGPEVAGGVELLRPDAHVLYMSGYADDALAKHGLAPAEIDFVQKPFSTDTLLRRIRKILDGGE